jgi:hypothetical protein
MTRGNPRRAARTAGLRFEQAVVRRLRALFPWWTIVRTDEADGHVRGRDIDVLVPRLDSDGRRYVGLARLPVAIQCKATGRAADAARGIREALRHNRHDAAWLCIHSLRGPGRPEIRVLWKGSLESTPVFVPWDALRGLLPAFHPYVNHAPIP